MANNSPFINALLFLKETFKKPIVFKVKSDIRYLENGRFIPQVRLASSILEGNLRMIDTYLPEILFVLASNCKPHMSLKETIDQFEEEFIKKDKLFTQPYLKVKLLHFFEAIFFAQIFGKVWHGKWEKRYFVLKDDNELKYYHMVNAHEFILSILSRYTFSFVYVKGNTYKINISPVFVS